MGVSWKYDILFSFQVTYSGQLNPGDFKISPSSSCKALLKKHNLVFKPATNGGMVIMQKKVLDDGTTEPAYKITKPLGFTFILELRNISLLNQLKPYSAGPLATYPNAYGKKRILYLDNLNDTLALDKEVAVVGPFMDNLELVTQKVSNKQTVDEQDWASVVPNAFEYQRRGGITGINLQPLRPSQNAAVAYNLSGSKPKAQLELQQGGYLFSQVGSGRPTEIIFSSNELLRETPLAVIQIYKDETTNYNRSVRYTIDFEKP